jgi:hypothetical protein
MFELGHRVFWLYKLLIIFISVGKVAKKHFKIYDVRGRLVYEKSNINTTTTALKDLKAEQYVLLVKITSDDN